MEGQCYDTQSQQYYTPREATSQQQLPPTPARSEEPQQAKAIITPDLPIDYRLLILSLAEQYIAQARSLGPVVASGQDEAPLQEYHKLMATAFCCFEAVLKKHRQGLKPREEGSIILRYASLLHEETENDHDIESLLSKAIPVCERNRLFDLKYSMQHLLTRVIFKSKQKAAFKYLDNAVQEAVVLGHTVWIYALRFLRIALALQIGSPHELSLAIAQIHEVVHAAKKAGDKSIMAMAAILEAFIHLRVRSVDSVTEAQRALAAAQGSLMSLPQDQVPAQLQILLSILDLSCSLDPHDSKQTKTKMVAMQKLVEGQDQTGDQVEDDRVLVPIERSQGGALTYETAGIFCQDKLGRDCLAFSWLSTSNVHLLAYLLSGIAMHHAKAPSIEFLRNGLVSARKPVESREATIPASLADATRGARFKQLTAIYCLLYLTFLKLDCSTWDEADKHLHELEVSIKLLGSSASSDLKLLATYAEAVTGQANGHFEDALQRYYRLFTSLPPPNDRNASDVHTQISVLAGLNMLMIIHPSAHPSNHLVPTILERLAPHFPGATANPTVTSSNLHLTAAYSLIQHLTSTSLIERKPQLQKAINTARSANNRHLLTLCMAQLYSFMFKGIMGENSLNTAKAALTAARGYEDKTWTCVADGLLGGALELEGQKEQSARCFEDAKGYLADLPGDLGLDVKGDSSKEEEAGLKREEDAGMQDDAEGDIDEPMTDDDAAGIRKAFGLPP